MIKINELKIIIQTENGARYFHNRFSEGVNVITSSMNTSGKSAVINAIVYCLGMEELIGGGKGGKALSTAFHNKIWDAIGNREQQKEIHDVQFSTIFLEISNGKENITLKRNVKSPSKNDNLITIYFSEYNNIKNNIENSKDYFVNSAGAAVNERGFFNFLEKFLSLDLPQVPKFNGQVTKLYLQNVFGAMFIEQKRGWSDILAKVPNYGIVGVKQRVIEYLLKLEILDNEKKKVEIKKKIQEINEAWKLKYLELKKDIYPFNIYGISEELRTNVDLIQGDKVNLLLDTDSTEIKTIDKHLEDKIIEEKGLNSKSIVKVDDVYNLSKENQKVELALDDLKVQRIKLIEKISIIKTELEEYIKSEENISEDIKNNQDLLKLKELGSKEKISLFDDICPVCHQTINDSLLDSQQDIHVMSIEQNIKYLKDQQTLFRSLIVQKKKTKEEFEKNLQLLTTKENTLFSLMRAIKDDIYSVSEANSEVQIEKKVRLSIEIEEIKKIKAKFEESVQVYKDLSNKLKKENTKLKELPKNHLSKLDEEKLKKFSRLFVSYLRDFDYRSISSLSDVSISMDSYMPVANDFDLKADTSASDNIRMIWAYTLGLLNVSSNYNINHLNLVIFDEPKQQSIHEKDIIKFFEKAMELKNNQIIIGFTQDQLENPQVLLDQLKHKGCNIIDLGEKAFKKEQR